MLKDLGPKARRIVVLRYLLGLGEAEVAAASGYSAASAKQIFRRAKARL